MGVNRRELRVAVVARVLTSMGTMPRRLALVFVIGVAGTMSAAVATQPQTGSLSAPAEQEYLLRFQGPVEEPWKAAVAAAGVTVLEYVPDFAFRVRLRPNDAGAVRALPFVTSLTPYQAASKLTRMRTAS